MDSNGSMTIGGGCVYICGAASSGEVPIDYSGTGVITGGTLLATGSSTRMLQSFGGASTQPTTVVALESPHSGGEAITLLDAGSSVLAAFTPAHAYQLVIISHPDLTTDAACTLTAGSEQRAVTVGSDTYMAEGSFGRGGFDRGGGNKGSFGTGRGGETPPADPAPDGDAMPPEDFDPDMVPPDSFDPGMVPPEDGFTPEGFGPDGIPPEEPADGDIAL